MALCLCDCLSDDGDKGRESNRRCLSVQRVLFVPRLRCNLVSVAQLIEELDCIVIFANKFWVIQDRILKTLIGAGEKRDEVYILRATESGEANHVVKGDAEELWHYRMGHPAGRIE